MMVTFISQCEKNALKKIRRVLDAFAEHKALDLMFDQVKDLTKRLWEEASQ